MREYTNPETGNPTHVRPSDRREPERPNRQKLRWKAPTPVRVRKPRPKSIEDHIHEWAEGYGIDSPKKPTRELATELLGILKDKINLWRENPPTLKAEKEKRQEVFNFHDKLRYHLAYDPDSEKGPEFTKHFVEIQAVGLTRTHSDLLSWIEFFDKGKGCWASNAWLASRLDLHPSSITRLLHDLKLHNFVRVVEGRIRHIRVLDFREIHKKVVLEHRKTQNYKLLKLKEITSTPNYP